ncbi:sterol desaturase family protein [Aldersonia kunmingensis]|uniref:sterol desaturase family protein n=1 Tax=Aldersonia kunmingensis TaxID=408066 RepID=UPI00083784C7|nr:sterol desaturase family protein [Aldersonia kunmingensis]
MFDLIAHAIPVFVICLIIEAASYRFLRDDERNVPDGQRGYNMRDSATSIGMGLGNVVINIGWKLVVIAVYSAVYLVAPIHLSPTNPLTWIALFFLDDFAYYWFHRLHHTVRVLWASHVVHHSSTYFNLSTALRQTWTPMTSLPFWLPLALLGFSPWMILLQQSVSLLYQFFVHTERVGKLWRPIEFIWNTPSHHRVHHASNADYLDRNYAGILIIWDRMFGTFAPERERAVYGLTKNIDTFNPVRVAFGEYANILRDVRTARRWRDRFGHMFRGPGWQPVEVPVEVPALARS